MRRKKKIYWHIFYIFYTRNIFNRIFIILYPILTANRLILKSIPFPRHQLALTWNLNHIHPFCAPSSLFTPLHPSTSDIHLHPKHVQVHLLRLCCLILTGPILNTYIFKSLDFDGKKYEFLRDSSCEKSGGRDVIGVRDLNFYFLEGLGVFNENIFRW